MRYEAEPATMNPNPGMPVVDDVETVLECCRMVFASANFTVQAAKTGHEALDMLAHQAFDVVFTEYLMPGSDGPAVLRAIKNFWPDTAVVVIAGAASVAHAKQAIPPGASDCLAKPVAADEVIKAAARAAIQEKWTLRRIPGRDPAQSTHEGESS